jgi:mRNA-degrading endonuclease YafQ of YafQ-DinJ toxin-antitoxin module
LILPIGCHGQDDREFSGFIGTNDIARQLDAIRHGHHDIFFDPQSVRRRDDLIRKKSIQWQKSSEVKRIQLPEFDILKIIYRLYGMWRIEEHRRVDKQVAVMPKEILKRYEKWKDIAAISGPPGLRLIKGLHDEALSGEWQGYRSSRLGLQWRVVYRVIPEGLLFQVASITAHEYRRS